MGDLERNSWFQDFSAFFSPFNKPMSTSFPIDDFLFGKVMFFDPKTKNYTAPFPDTIANPTDPEASAEDRKKSVETLYNAAKKGQLIIPSENGPLMVGVGEDGGPSTKPLNRENVEAQFPPWNDNPAKKWFKRLVNRIFPKAFKADIERDRLHEEAMQACNTLSQRESLTIDGWSKKSSLNEHVRQRQKIIMKASASLERISDGLSVSVKDMSQHDRTEMSRDNKIRTNFALFSAAYILKNASKEDTKAFLTGDSSRFSEQLKDLITKSHREFQSLRNQSFANDSRVDYTFRDPQASLEALKVITGVMLQEPELSPAHTVAGTLSKAFVAVVRQYQANAAPADRLQLKDDDKKALSFGENALPTMGGIYLQSISSEEYILGASHDGKTGKPVHPEDFASIISKDVVNSILAENRSVLSSLPPEKVGTIPMKELSASMQIMFTDMFNEKNVYSLVAECGHANLAADPNFLAAHILSPAEDKHQIGNIFMREGKKVVFDKLAKQAAPSVEINQNVVVAGRENTRNAEPPGTEAPAKDAVVKYDPRQAMGRF